MLMEKILEEVIGVKSMVGKLEQQTNKLNSTVQSMQEDNVVEEN